MPHAVPGRGAPGHQVLPWTRPEAGCLQDGVDVGDVVLPPWAGGSPDECVRLHREALEGEVRSGF